MITPLTPAGGSIDYHSLKNLMSHLASTGSDSILVTGTTGENPTLTHEEEYDLLKACININNTLDKSLPIIFGAGSNSTQTAVRVSSKAQELGADAVMSVTPYYNKPNQDGIYRHFEAVAREIDIPVMLYNNPGRTMSYINPETIIELNNNYANINALKESSSQCFDTISKLEIAKSQKILKNNLDIYIGDDSLILPALSLDCAGVVSVASHIIGDKLQNIIQTQDKQEVLKYYELFDLLFASPSPGPIKYILKKLNIIDNSDMRLPLTPPDEQLCEKLDKYLNRIKHSV